MGAEVRIMRYEGVKAISELPLATVEKVYLGNDEEIESRKAVLENGEFVQFVSNHYTLVQHADAFSKAIKQMEVPKDAKISFNTMRGRANMRVYFDQLKIDDGTKLGIELGFEVRNSYDKSTSLGLQVKRTEFDKSGRYIVLCAQRLVCKNGMTIMVPLAELTEVEHSKLTAKDVHAVEKGVIQIDTKRVFSGSVKHMGELELKYSNILNMAKKAVPYIEGMIERAKKKAITVEELELWLEAHGFSGKTIEKIVALFEKEKSKNVWSAYNSCTYVGTRLESERQVERVLTRSWTLMVGGQ